MREVGSVARRYAAGYAADPPERGRLPEAFDVYVRSHGIADHSDFSSRTSGGLDQSVVAGPAAPLKTVVLFDSFGASLMPRAALHRGMVAGLRLLPEKSVGERSTLGSDGSSRDPHHSHYLSGQGHRPISQRTKDFDGRVAR